MKKIKERIFKIINSYKTIIFISLIINIILLILLNNTITNNKIYTFSGENEYIKVNDGLIVLNSDINLLNGNNIKYVNKEDYNIKSYKLGYYVMDNNKLVELISTNFEFENEMLLSETINNFTSFNIFEKNSTSTYFTKYKKNLIDDGIYLVLEAKTTDGNTVFCKVNLTISKISKY
ncbi:MAG: hypothetical protein IJD92_02040 [Bacilli bacterium]|nr:hypothetical protein [Bacilli bacterium]